MRGRFRLGDLGMFLLLSALWGTAFMFNALGLRTFSPFLFAAFRFDLAAAVLFLIVVLRRRGRWTPETRSEWLAVWVGAVFLIAAHNAVFLWGQRTTTAGIASVIVGLNPLLTAGASRLLLRSERLGWWGHAGLLLGFLGIVVLTLLKPGTTFDARGTGEAFIVLSVVLWAFGSVVVQRLEPRMDLVAFTAWQCLLAAPMLHVGALAFEGGGSVEWTAGGVASILYLACGATGLGLLLYFSLASRIGPVRVNLWSYVAPVFAMAAGAIVLGEEFEARSVFALGLIGIGFLLVARSKGEPAAAAGLAPTQPMEAPAIATGVDPAPKAVPAVSLPGDDAPGT